MTMSHTCVDWTCLPSGKLIITGLTATRLLSASASSIMKMEVAPVSATACVVAIVNAFRYCGVGQPNNLLAAKALVCRVGVAAGRYWENGDDADVTFDVATVKLLSQLGRILI
jgi:hypothetical protein